ncbi:MAG: LCP family protein [Candidatus Pacebacteria bacterium]|nr:LCP family protein [Candidatus Paceibacterota bacterium]MDR3583076.1 LCP family protein [Candidatus Paceibacterota bacterium]
MTKKNIAIKITLWTVLAALLLVAAYGAFLIWKVNETGNRINAGAKKSSSVFDTVKNLANPDSSKLDGFASGRINILLLGVAGAGKPGTNLTDTIMVASLNTKTDQVSLLSIPRDLYVQIPNATYQDKINTVYQYGLSQYPKDPEKSVEPLESVVKNITSLDINYWVVMDFDGFRAAIDDIGGVNITNPRDINDPTYPGPNYSYEDFKLGKGFHHLDGAVALKYARMRHDDPEGDFGRAKRQQQILQAAKNKIFSTGTFLNLPALNKLFDDLGDNIKTNIQSDQFGNFVELTKQLDTANINNQVIDAWNPGSLLVVSHLQVGNMRAFILIPRIGIGNWTETRELAQNIFNTNAIAQKSQEIYAENAKVAVINESGNATVLSRINSLLTQSFGYKNVAIITDPQKNLEEKSTAYDLTNGAKPFTLNELVAKLPAAASYAPPENFKTLTTKKNPDLILVIGQDLISKYGMAQDSFADYNNSNGANE